MYMFNPEISMKNENEKVISVNKQKGLDFSLEKFRQKICGDFCQKFQKDHWKRSEIYPTPLLWAGCDIRSIFM